MLIYLAAPYKRRAEVLQLAAYLKDDGITTSSRWAYWTEEEHTEELNALKDLADIQRAGAFVLLNPKEWLTEGQGGRHVEFGFAHAIGKPILIVGERTNVFHYLPGVAQYPTLQQNYGLVRAIQLVWSR